MTRLEYMEALRSFVLTRRLEGNIALPYVAKATLEYIDETCLVWGGQTLGRTTGFTRLNNFHVRIWGKSILTKRGFGLVMVHELCHIVAEIHNPGFPVVHGPAFWRAMENTMFIHEMPIIDSADKQAELPHVWLKPDLPEFIDSVGEVEGLR